MHILVPVGRHLGTLAQSTHLAAGAAAYLAMLHLACGLIAWRAADWERLPQ